MTVPPQIFDRTALRRHRDRAAARFHEHDFLFREVGDRLLDRLQDFSRRFPLALDLGARTGFLGACLDGRGGIERLIALEPSAGMAALAAPPRVVADEEMLPFAAGCFDLVISNLSLHWANDLPGALIQARRALKPDGLLLAAVFGGETLAELRAALLQAEAEVSGGGSPRVSPTADIRDLGMLLSRAGFALPVVDSDLLSVTYPDALALMRDLRAMGEANALAERLRRPTRRDVLLRAAAAYPAAPDGRITAQFQVIFLTAWAPHESQQRPKARGSAQHRLADALKPDEP